GKTIRFVRSSNVESPTMDKCFYSQTDLSQKTEPTKFFEKQNEFSWLKPKAKVTSHPKYISKPKSNTLPNFFKKPKVSKPNEFSKQNSKTINFFGKRVKVTQIWIPKELTRRGPK
ncbi:hypothetical protein, partial [Serratia marcescens]|uniref:hypothetical protein n=1 Tax=Serratia marcescens TaxID=615 RepID=UPI0028137859